MDLTTEPLLTAEALAEIPGLADSRLLGASWRLAVRSLPESLPPLLGAVEAASARLLALSTHRATLEDVFVSLTGRDLRDV